MNSLVGYTGFVGSNLTKSFKFDNLYNSKNIKESFGTKPDLLVYSGVRAEMFLANTNPDADLDIIKDAIENIKKINPKRLVLISTIEIYDHTDQVNEETRPNAEKTTAYGKNRLYLENWVQQNFNEYLIVRLPAIYGANLKKNFIYDIIHRTPAMLKDEKLMELCNVDDFIKDYYVNANNGFYKCTNPTVCKSYFEKIGFSAINFTDSRSVYQFYNLKYLWGHIEDALNRELKILNIATEPISVDEVYTYLFGEKFQNELNAQPFNYNMKTKYYKDSYIFDKQFVLQDIKNFVQEKSNEIIDI